MEYCSISLSFHSRTTQAHNYYYTENSITTAILNPPSLSLHVFIGGYTFTPKRFFSLGPPICFLISLLTDSSSFAVIVSPKLLSVHFIYSTRSVSTTIYLLQGMSGGGPSSPLKNQLN